MKCINIATACAVFALLPASVQAQQAEPVPATTAQPAFNAGASVTGNDGNPIGTVAQVTERAIIVDTGVHQVPLPREAFGSGDAGLTLNLTKAELETTYAEQIAAQDARLEATLVAGTPVTSADAIPLGTVDSINGEEVVLAIGEQRMALGRDAFAVDATGALTVRASKAQIDEAIQNTAAPAS